MYSYDLSLQTDLANSTNSRYRDMNVGSVLTLQFKKRITCRVKVLRYGVLVYKSDIVVYVAVS